MNCNIQSWVLSAILTVAVAAGIASRIVPGQSAQDANEPRPGTRADLREDREEARRLRKQIRLDRERLEADIRQYGPGSPQVKADREKLRSD